LHGGGSIRALGGGGERKLRTVKRGHVEEDKDKGCGGTHIAKVRHELTVPTGDREIAASLGNKIIFLSFNDPFI
jgi:hypothetical protein